MGNLQRIPAVPVNKDLTSAGPASGTAVVLSMPSEKDRCACELARKVSRSITQLYDLVMAPSHLKSSQYILLRTIADAGEVAQWRISKELSVAVETLTRRLSSMRKKGWVELREGRDRREHLYRITESGRVQIDRARPYWQRAQQRLREQLGEGEWLNLQRSLDHLNKAAILSLSMRRKNTVS